jgi:hypothetical protein
MYISGYLEAVSHCYANSIQGCSHYGLCTWDNASKPGTVGIHVLVKCMELYVICGSPFCPDGGLSKPRSFSDLQRGSNPCKCCTPRFWTVALTGVSYGTLVNVNYGDGPVPAYGMGNERLWPDELKPELGIVLCENKGNEHSNNNCCHWCQTWNLLLEDVYCSSNPGAMARSISKAIAFLSPGVSVLEYWRLLHVRPSAWEPESPMVS